VLEAIRINRFGKLDGRKGAKIWVWIAAKALPGKHSQNVAFCLYLALLRNAHCRAERIRQWSTADAWRRRDIFGAGHERFDLPHV